MRRGVRAAFASALAASSAAFVACMGGGTSTTQTSQNSQPGSGETSCIPGQSVACLEDAGCSGYRVCGDDGLHYEPCVCPDADTGIVGQWTARCRAPDGDAIGFTSRADVFAKLAAQWWLCGGAAAFWEPVEFTEDGHYYLLTLVDGGFQRNLGPDTSGTYDIVSEGMTGGFMMTFTTASGSGPWSITGGMQAAKMDLGGGTYLRLP